MAAPNIVNVTTITGKTAVFLPTTVAANVIVNAASSNQVYKINSIIVANINGVNDADITVSLLRSSVAYRLASTVTVPADATLVVVSKDMSIYLEEGDAIQALASANTNLETICSYEIIS